MSIFWPDANARDICRLFREDPDGWTCDRFDARHAASGLEVWIANSSFALSVRIQGGPRLYGFYFPVGTASQIAIWRAFKRWRNTRVRAAIRKATTASAVGTKRSEVNNKSA